jgi:hypothetical protein
MQRRRVKTVADYPLTMERTCPLCHERVVSTRRGSGKPWRGGLDYWYADDHVKTCSAQAEREVARRLSAGLNETLFGDGVT